MKILKEKITLEQLRAIAQGLFGDMVKAVVDIEKGIIVIDAELHADEEALLIQYGSDQKNLWGINVYVDIAGDNWIEFDSMINVRPAQGNKSRGVENIDIQKKIRSIVHTFIER